MRLFILPAAAAVAGFAGATPFCASALGPAGYRWFLFLLPPVILGLSGLVARQHKPQRQRPQLTAWAWGIPLGLTPFALEAAYLPAGFRWGLLDNLTYQDMNRFVALVPTSLIALPLCALAGMVFMERPLRRWQISLPSRLAGGAAAAAVALLLHIPWFAAAWSPADWPFALSGAVTVALREVMLAALFIATGQWIAGGIIRGLWMFTEFFVMGDVLSPYLPAGGYASSQAEFYFLRPAILAIVTSAVVAAAIWRARKEQGLDPLA